MSTSGKDSVLLAIFFLHESFWQIIRRNKYIHQYFWQTYVGMSITAVTKVRHRAPAQFFFFSGLRIQFSAGQFWQRNRGNIGISPQPLVGSPRRGCRTKGLDPARRGMPYLPLTEFFCPFNDHSPPAIRRGDLLASSRPSPPCSPPTLRNAPNRRSYCGAWGMGKREWWYSYSWRPVWLREEARGRFGLPILDGVTHDLVWRCVKHCYKDIMV